MLSSFEKISKNGNDTLRSPDQSQNITSMLTSGEFTGDESPNSKRRTAHALASGGMSDFIKVSRRNSWNELKSERRRKAMQFISSPYVANFMVMVVMFDSYSTCADIDARASGHSVDPWLSTLSKVCLVLYTVEMFLLLSLRGINLLRKDMLMFVDLLIIICGYAEWILGQFLPDLLDLRLLRTLRFLRIIRLLRLLRKIHGLRELQKLVTMMATCLKALAWSFLFCFVIMTVWAMLMVEIVHPIIQQLHREKNIFSDCEQCVQAASSVMHANLLLFKTVIAGDSWGTIAVPVIEEYPATAIIFMGSLLTIVFGVLNLIVAVVVDTFAEARERDVLNLAEEMERNHENDKKFLQKVFERIDEDGSGELTLDELVEGARKDPEFQSRLRVMDIDEVDLQQLFEMIDVDGSGSIEAAEFIAPLSRWVHDSKTAPRFIKYNMLRSMQQQDELYRQSHYQFNALSTRIEELTNTVESLVGNTAFGLSAAPMSPGASGVPVMPVVPGSLFDSMTSRTMTTMEMSEAHLDNRLSPREPRDVRGSLASSAVNSEPMEPLDELDHKEKHLDEIVVDSDQPEQPQASTALDWRQSSKTRARNRLGSDESASGRRSSLPPEHVPAVELKTPMETPELAAAFSANSQLLKAAMESLETALMASTESAIRRSMALVEFAIHTELGHHRNDRRGNVSSICSNRNSIHQKEPTKWTSLFPNISPNLSPHHSEDPGGLHRSATIGHGGGAQNAALGTAHASPTTPKEPDENAKPVLEDMGERIHRSRRRVATHDVPLPYSRRTARHSFANAHLQFSAKV